jgi:hypothetical protein
MTACFVDDMTLLLLAVLENRDDGITASWLNRQASARLCPRAWTGADTRQISD